MGLQAVRLGEQLDGLREQVKESQRLARYTGWMALFVALASLAQVATVALLYFAE